MILNLLQFSYWIPSFSVIDVLRLTDASLQIEEFCKSVYARNLRAVEEQGFMIVLDYVFYNGEIISGSESR